MRWIWIDKFIEFQSGRRAVALKNVTLAEEHLHDHFPGFPVMPECLMIEAMAQTSGILVGEAKDFQEKVILAKIKKAVFFDYVKPEDTIKLDAKIESIVSEAASTSGKITCDDKLIAEIDLMFEQAGRCHLFECKLSKAPKPSRGFFELAERIKPESAWVIAPVDTCYRIKKGISVCPLDQLELTY